MRKLSLLDHMTSSCRLLACRAEATFCFITAGKQRGDTGDRLTNRADTSEDGEKKKSSQIVKKYTHKHTHTVNGRKSKVCRLTMRVTWCSNPCNLKK